MERLSIKSKLPGYTLIEMLSAVAIIGLVLPVLFSVLINSYNNLSKIEKLQFIAKKSVDIRGIGLYSLGAHRKNLSDDQKKEYSKLHNLKFLGME